MNEIESAPPVGQMKLFVVGSSSGNPADWSEFGSRAFVMAESLEQALAMVDFSSSGAEVACAGPTIVCLDRPSPNGEF